MKKIFSIALNMHDHNTYDGIFHNQIERYTRRKHNLIYGKSHSSIPSREFFQKYFIKNYHSRCHENIFAFTCSNLGLEFVSDLLDNTLPDKEFLKFKPKNLWDKYQTKDFYYIDHHQSHAAYAFLSSGFAESDILAIDGRGWHYNCVFFDKNGNMTDLSEVLAIGGLWNRISQDIGFGYLGAGKVMGLSAFGVYRDEIQKVIDQYLNNPDHKLSDNSSKIISSTPKEDVAYTLQYATIQLIQKYVYPLKTSDNICVAGGVAYNGYMNEELTKIYKSVHVPPAVGDEGQAIGTYMHADYVINKNVHVPNVYSGAEHCVDKSLFTENLNLSDIAQSIANGKIVGWFQGKSESGNRALGNRSILADPRNPDIKNIINRTIKFREDFRPFAPSVLEEYYQDYFNTNQPSPYMSRIVSVISDAIPGVTHIDNTARIQTVNKRQNEKFYNLIFEFYKITGIPMLVNTSFNCQEPIVETPQEAYNTFQNTKLDILVINDMVLKK